MVYKIKSLFTSWAGREYGIFAQSDVSEILLARSARSFDFWYKQRGVTKQSNAVTSKEKTSNGIKIRELKNMNK